MNRFPDYTTDELFAIIAHAELGSDLHIDIEIEIEHRQNVRRAWLDHCNEVAGEVIA